MEPIPTTIRVPWDRLRAWIEDQEEYEHDHGQSAPLTKTQLEALSRLVSFSEKEPDVSGGNFVSLLTELVQARRLSTPTFVDESITVPVEGHLMMRFRCVCSVANYGSFPGLEEGRDAPAFQSKKDAKQYAAKHALEYLQQHSSSSSKTQKHKKARLNPAPTPPSHPSQRRDRQIKEEEEEEEKEEASLSSSRKDGRTTTSSSTTTNTNTNTNTNNNNNNNNNTSTDDDDDGDAMIRKATDLAMQMGFGTLSFVIEPDGELENFFRGKPVFSQSASLVPPAVAVVSGVLGKKQARVQVAAHVFLWLDSKARAKKTTFANLFSISR